jgi:hypothetical protein
MPGWLKRWRYKLALIVTAVMAMAPGGGKRIGH